MLRENKRGFCNRVAFLTSNFRKFSVQKRGFAFARESDFEIQNFFRDRCTDIFHERQTMRKKSA